MKTNIEYRNDLPRSTMFDLIMFYNTYKQLGAVGIIGKEFKALQSCWITKDMQTIWQLSAINNEKYAGAIGMQDYSELSFYKDMIDQLLTANPAYKSMEKLIRT